MAELITANQVASELGLSRYTVYKMANSGVMPCYRLGRAVRFDLQEVRAWTRQQSVDGKENSNEGGYQ